MFIDVVVLSGISVIALMLAFFSGVFYFLRKDAKKHPGKRS